MKHLASLRLFAAGTGFALALLTLPAQAQSDPGSGGPVPGNPSADPTSVPIDGGASLLLAGGAAYALARLRKRRQPAQ